MPQANSRGTFFEKNTTKTLQVSKKAVPLQSLLKNSFS